METEKSLPTGPRIRCGGSCRSAPAAAVGELAQAIGQPDSGLVMVFASSSFDQTQLAAALSEHFAGLTVIGCTTAAEIGPLGYHEASLSGFSIHRADLDFELGLLEDLSRFEHRAGQLFAHGLKEALRRRQPDLTPEDIFAFMLVDGLCGREESVSRAFFDGLGGIAMVGGSASAGPGEGQTWLLHQGRFVADAALLLVATSPFPFFAFKTQHFVAGDEPLIVTGALPDRRVVTEINGCPAAEEYARAIGIDPARLDPAVFAANPVVVRIGNSDFVRAIRKMDASGALTFFCAVDEGIILKVARSVDMLDNLRQALAGVGSRLGPPALILGCDCSLRHLEAKARGIGESIGNLLAANRVVGFSTYGEQYAGMHINQTFTGLAIGRERRK